MARKISRDVQVKKIEDGMGKLSLSDQLDWIKSYFAKFPHKQVVCAGIVEAIEIIQEPHRKKTYQFGDTYFSDDQVLAFAQGYDEKVQTLDRAIELLENHGYMIGRIEE